MEWLLETALLILLAATLFHAMRLERALGVLKRDRAALEELVDGFNSSTRAAEQGIERLRAAAEGAGRQVQRQVETASGLKDDLLFLTERGERLADRLDLMVRAARPLASVAAPSSAPAAPPEPAPYAAEEPVVDESDPPAASVAALSSVAGPWAPGGTGLRSQAERDLLRALRMAR
jgi:hypothetical protein